MQWNSNESKMFRRACADLIGFDVDGLLKVG
jgi:hypothetical protein